MKTSLHIWNRLTGAACVQAHVENFPGCRLALETSVCSTHNNFVTAGTCYVVTLAEPAVSFFLASQCSALSQRLGDLVLLGEAQYIRQLWTCGNQHRWQYKGQHSAPNSTSSGIQGSA